MVSILLDSVSNKFIKVVLPRALDGLDLSFVLNLEQLRHFSEGVKLTVVPVVQFRSHSDAQVHGVLFGREFGFLRENGVSL